jgi:hypothetical protein
VPRPRDCTFVSGPVVKDHPNAPDAIAALRKLSDRFLKFFAQDKEGLPVGHTSKVSLDASAADHRDFVIAKRHMELYGPIDIDASITGTSSVLR